VYWFLRHPLFYSPTHAFLKVLKSKIENLHIGPNL
jgi:hypothetical protein